MAENGLIEVWTLPHVNQAEIAGVVAEKACDEDNDESHYVAGLERVDGQEENETSYHAIDHAYNCHRNTELLLLVLPHTIPV